MAFKNIIGSYILFDNDCIIKTVHFNSIFMNGGMMAFDQDGKTI
jgi:hypothetical protein